MTYTITKNPQFNSLEIMFEGKPSDAIRQALKDLKFRWHSVKKVWYGYASEEETRKAIDTGKAEKKAPVAKKVPVFDKELLRSEFAKVWKGDCLNRRVDEVAAYAVLPSGEIVTVDKQRIETRFCFGESGYDYDDAIKAAQHARESNESFKSENMRDFKGRIEDIKNVMNGTGRYTLTIASRQRRTDGYMIRSLNWELTTDILDSLGGSAFLEELPGKVVNVRGFESRIATAEELELILKAYETAAAAHEKKVDAYLKRYGTSKVHAWTYWIDA